MQLRNKREKGAVEKLKNGKQKMGSNKKYYITTKSPEWVLAKITSDDSF